MAEGRRRTSAITARGMERYRAKLDGLWTVAARRGRPVISVRYMGPLLRLPDGPDAMMPRFEEGEP